MTLDLVAVSYQAPDETARFLASLAHVDVPFTLTVIDNASPDPRVRQAIHAGIARLDGSLCTDAWFVANKTNVGYARAVNHGMTYGRNPYAAILNCDVQFLPEGIHPLLAHFVSHPEVGVIGPRTFDSTGRLTHAGIVTTLDNPHNHHRGWLSPNGPQYGDTLTVNTVSGATYFVRREMWDQLTGCPAYRDAVAALVGESAEGAFLPTPHYFEETFCSYHAKAHGWTSVYFGGTSMIHEWHRSSPIGSQDMSGARLMFFEACARCGIHPEGEL